MKRPFLYAILSLVIVAGSFWQTLRLLPGVPAQIVLGASGPSVSRHVVFVIPGLMLLAAFLLLVKPGDNALRRLGGRLGGRILVLDERSKAPFYPVLRGILFTAVLCLELLLMLLQKIVIGLGSGQGADRSDRINLVFIVILAVFFAVSHSGRLKLMLKEAEREAGPASE